MFSRVAPKAARLYFLLKGRPMNSRVFLLAGLLSLATPALAAGETVTADPPVEDGDLGCFIATGVLAFGAGRIAKDESKPADTREAAAKREKEAFEMTNFYMGRMTAQLTAAPSKQAYSEAYQRFAKLDADGKSKVVQACETWARDSKLKMLEPWGKD